MDYEREIYRDMFEEIFSNKEEEVLKGQSKHYAFQFINFVL
jgi:hypothetical protein